MGLTLIAKQGVIVLTLSMALALISVGLRIWSRHLKGARHLFSDYMVIVATVLGIGVYANAMIPSEYSTGGLGVHIGPLMRDSPWVLPFYLKTFLPSQILWAACNSCVKLSILSLYTHIFPNKRFVHVCYSIMGITFTYFTSVLIEAFAFCQPVEFNWNKSIPGKCGNQGLAFIIAGIMNLVLDAVIVILPMPMLFRLQMTLPKRIGIAAMFGLGALICVFSLMRVLWVAKLDMNDLLFGVGEGTIWSGLEPLLGISNACLPVMKPALIRIFPTQALGWTKKTISSVKRSTVATGQGSHPSSTGDNPGHGFERLGDEIPLTNVSAHRRGHMKQSGDSITITQGWEVSSAMHKI